MRLSTIKLAGFKSFVDPLSIKFPGNLTGIVGPNGCGKSNIIDAVRWVMGESSAKHLRGSSMEDVIFNGSSSRKPVGMATVELIFDNSEGRAKGAYASYSEISAKRSVGRDGQSRYSLNGTRCRRKDIADLFFGTGLGPRSYAIIEQGMISRLIEAKPEELRVFLEEAAGISKYKERRRETENRIRHTRDNLDRLNDLREEIDKQLTHLQRQSRAAEKYKELKQEERTLRAQQLALYWRELNSELQDKDQVIQKTQTTLEEIIAAQRSVEAEIEQARIANTEANDHLNDIQGEYYSVGAEISSVEQNIKHQIDLQQRQQTDFDQIEATLNSAVKTLMDDRATIDEINEQLASDQPEVDVLKDKVAEINDLYQQSVIEMQEWQSSWDEINHRHADFSQQTQVESSRIEQLEKNVEQLAVRLKKITLEQESLSDEETRELIDRLSVELKSSEFNKTTLDTELQNVIDKINAERDLIRELEKNEDELRRNIHDFQGRLSSLDELQQDALGKTNRNIKQWLKKHGLNNQKRIAEQINVESGWETAVEVVLGDKLESVCVDSINKTIDVINELTDSSLSLYETDTTKKTSSTDARYLLSKMKSKINLDHFLSGIFIANNINDALKIRKSLKGNESVVTKDGVWLSRNWLQISRDVDEKQGVLSRGQDIRELQNKLAEYEKAEVALNKNVENSKKTLKTIEQKREVLQEELNVAHSAYSELQAQISAGETRLEHISDRSMNLVGESGETSGLIESEKKEILDSIVRRDESLNQLHEIEREQADQEIKRDQLRLELNTNQESLQNFKDKLHEVEIRIEGLNTRRNSLYLNIERLEDNHKQQQDRKREIVALIASSAAPVEELERQLKTLLSKQLQTEQTLSDARQAVNDIDQKVRELDQQRTEHEQNAQEIRDSLEKFKLDSQETRVRSKTTIEQLDELKQNVKDLLKDLTDEHGSKEWNDKLIKTANRVQRLGPINLAAIDEYEEQKKRKEYLDEQHLDVTTALETLESAIAKIDKETRTRFKETFDQVNARINEMFPRLFGGGSARLEMTGNDLLSTGVAVMAKPPGKRITNIHLLSGGEKALTAIALVFAIFELNPAPFCMLDEVDAPLDEANVGRFCKLVKEMSNRLQFIYITHNKTTMEMSEHLSGVTMREAGVSRLVAVDVAEAATMAAV